jgi:hypothetical protein
MDAFRVPVVTSRDSRKSSHVSDQPTTYGSQVRTCKDLANIRTYHTNIQSYT